MERLYDVSTSLRHAVVYARALISITYVCFTMPLLLYARRVEMPIFARTRHHAARAAE